MLVLLGPLELLVFRPIALIARCRGMREFVRGRKDWHRFERNGASNGRNGTRNGTRLAARGAA